jgi:very-short-patch-repair endonuclease
MPEKSRYERTEDITERARDLRADVSKTEARLWPRLSRGKMGASFRKQHPIGPYFADYCCVSLKLVIEIDGPLHDGKKDAARDRMMNERGYDVLRFSVEDVDRRFRSVIDTIHEHVQLRLLERDAARRTK